LQEQELNMSRKLIVGAAQLGPIARSDSRRVVVGRLIELMREAKSRGCDLVVYPELALTTFFPRWYFEQQDEVDTWFEREMPGPETQALFDEARRLLSVSISAMLNWLCRPVGCATSTRPFWSAKAVS
jgi:predicted amidohydrolase